MPVYDLLLDHPDGEIRLAYDPETSHLSGAALDLDAFGGASADPAAGSMGAVSTWEGEAHRTSPENPGRKTRAARRLKIVMGYGCPRACTYCSQGQGTARAEGAPATRQADAEAFLARLPTWWDGGEDGRGAGVAVELWGGEPLAHWARLVTLAEGFRSRWPRAGLHVFTAGDLLTAERVAYLDEAGFGVGVSHDGPGQYLRGADPLDDPVAGPAIHALLRRLGPSRMAFHPVLTVRHHSLAAVQEWIGRKLARAPADIPVSTEGLLTAYDARGLMLSPQGEEIDAVRAALLDEMISGAAWADAGLAATARNFVASLRTRRPLANVGQYCAMDRPDWIAVDLLGDLYSCQNVAANPDHHIGNVRDIEAARLSRIWHHSLRDECRRCPVVQLCQGGCAFQQGDLWRASCDNMWAWHSSVLGGILHRLTGGGRLREIAARDGTPLRGRPPRAA